MLAVLEIKRCISSKIRNNDFVNYWKKKAKERTFSSILGPHFGHYKSVAESKIDTKLHTMFLVTTITTGSVIVNG